MPRLQEIQNFVRTKYNEYLASSMIRDDVAGLIDLTCAESFNPSSLFSELLQNCNDAGSAINKKIQVEISFVGDYLILKHNGKHFDLEDVQGITSCAKSSNRKQVDEKAIGHKGIGFKSVFLLAEYVYLYSTEECSFRFDRATAEKDAGDSSSSKNPIPWQLMPIWTEVAEIDNEIKGLLDQDRVNFILRLKPDYMKLLKDEAKIVLEDGRILLFLDNISQLTLCGEVLEKTNKDPVSLERTSLESITIANNGKVLSRWFKFRSLWNLSNEIKEIQTAQRKLPLDQRAIPEKFLGKEKIPVSLVYRHREGRLIPLQGCKVFCHLPTEIGSDFPFIVNSDFFLDLGRMHLKGDNASKIWNAYIIECTYKMQFIALAYFSTQNDYWQDVLDLITIPEDLTTFGLDTYRERIAKQCFSGGRAFLVVRNCSDDGAIKIKGALVDTHGFIAEFGSAELKAKTINSHFKKFEKLNKIYPEGERYTLFQSLEITKYIKQHVNFFDTFSAPEANIKFAQFLKRMWECSKNQEVKDSIKIFRFILSKNNRLCSASTIFLLREEHHSLQNLSFLQCLHPSYQDESLKELVTWFESFGASYPSLGKIIALAADDKEKHIEIFSGLLDFLEENPSTEKLEESSKKLKLVTDADKLVTSSEAYLSDAQKPNFAMEKICPAFDGYVGNFYLNKFPKRETQVKKLLLLLGVSQDFTEDNFQLFVATLATAPEHFEYTRLVFSHLRMNGKVSKEKLRKGLEKLRVVDTKNNLQNAGDTYLTDRYKPELCLEKTVDTFPFVSSKYPAKGESLERWGKFFRVLGISATIEVSFGEVRRDNIKKTPIGNSYVEYLEKKYSPLCTYATRSYYSQHTITDYCTLQHAQQILNNSSLFWQVLDRNKAAVKKHLSNKITYETYYDKKPIESNLLFMAKQVIAAQLQIADYTQVALGDYYTPHCMHIFQDLEHGFQVLPVDTKVSKEMLFKFGFHDHFTWEHGLQLLEVIANAPSNKDNLNRILRIYQDFLKQNLEQKVSDSEEMKVEDNKEENKFDNLPLLTENSTYRSRTNLYGLNCKTFILTSGANEIFKKIPGLNDKDYQRLCQLFKLTLIDDQMLEYQVTEEEEDQKFLHQLQEKLSIIALAESTYKHNVTEEEITTFCQDFIKKAHGILSKYRFFIAKSITVSFKDVFTQEEDYWFDQKNCAVFCTGLEPYIITELCELVCSLLELAITSDDLAKIYHTSKNKLIPRYSNWNLSEERVATVDAFIHEHAGTETSDITFGKRTNPSQGDDDRVVKRQKQNSEEGVKIETAPSEFKKQVGKKGEEYVFNKYLKKYCEKHPEDLKETATGFEVSGEKNGKSFTRTFFWYNRTDESFKDHDMRMEIIKEDDAGNKTVHERIIEVKGTTQSTDTVNAHISSREWCKMKEVSEISGSRYDLWLVREVGKTDAHGVKFKNFYEQQVQGQEDKFKITYSRGFKI